MHLSVATHEAEPLKARSLPQPGNEKIEAEPRLGVGARSEINIIMCGNTSNIEKPASMTDAFDNQIGIKR